VRYDCGDKLGYLTANVDYALQRDDLAEGLRAHLQKLQ
jgi:UTP--glucose-1-phosphate uridylyltransferase